MANPFSALGSVPVMQTIQDMLQRQATLRNSQILGDERQQLIDLRKQEMDQRNATMKVLAADLQGGMDAPIDKSSIPSDSDTPIILAQKNVRQIQQEVVSSNRRAREIAQAGGSLEVAEQYRRDALNAQARLNNAMRELRLEQNNQAKQMGEAAGAINGENFQDGFQRLVALDPSIPRKYSFDRDVNDTPIWGPTTERTLRTIRDGSMTAKDQINEKLKADEAVEKAKDREIKRQEETVRMKKLDADAAISQVNAERAKAGKPLLGREGVSERNPKEPKTEASKSADRLQTIADKEPTKTAITSSSSAIRAYAQEKWPGYTFDSSIDAFARGVAAKANTLRAEAARQGKELDIDEATDQAIKTLEPFVRERSAGGYDLPVIGHVGGTKTLTYQRAGIKPITATTTPSATAPAKPQTADDYLKSLGIQ